MKRIFAATITVALGIFTAHFAIADQLDDEAAAAAKKANAPTAVMVKVDRAHKTVDVYRVPKIDKNVLHGNATHEAIEAAIRSIEVPANSLAKFTMTTTNELDSNSSTQACWWGGWYNNSSYWSWNNWGGYSYPYSYSYSYYPTYYYYPSSYSWYYPYSYPGYFNYGYNNYNYNYNYGWSYPYYGYNYGWYY